MSRTDVTQIPKGSNSGTQHVGLDEPSYKVGVADGRVQAIEESMDAIAALMVKAEAMIAAFGPDATQATRDNADHTVRALYLAFAAVAGAERGSAAFRSLLAESKARLGSSTSTMH